MVLQRCFSLLREQEQGDCFALYHNFGDDGSLRSLSMINVTNDDDSSSFLELEYYITTATVECQL